MRDVFKIQLDYYPNLTDEVLERAEFKTVWSGKRMEAGDKIVYALVYVKNTDDLKLINFLERELSEIAIKFNFIRFNDENDSLPILTFKDDTKKRNI